MTCLMTMTKSHSEEDSDMSTRMYTYCNVCGDPLNFGLDRGTKPHLTFDRGLNGEGILAPLPGKRGTADIHVCLACADIIAVVYHR